MTLIKGFNRVRNLLFSFAEWETYNPYLEHGEIGFAYNNGDPDRKPIAHKVGAGFWNDLPFEGADFYPYTDIPTNPIGDADGNLYGKPPSEILYLMLNPYQVPAISGLQNNAGGGGYGANKTLEIGVALSGSVNIQYNVSSPANLTSPNPMVVGQSGSVFDLTTNRFPNSGNIALPLIGTYQPTNIVSQSIYLTPEHTGGLGSQKTTTFNFRPRAIWGASLNPDITAGDVGSLLGENSRLTNTVEGVYAFTSPGYAWLLLPDMLDQSGMIFIDISTPGSTAAYGMSYKKTLSVNNGVGTYDYAFYRSDNLLNDQSTLEIVK